MSVLKLESTSVGKKLGNGKMEKIA